MMGRGGGTHRRMWMATASCLRQMAWWNNRTCPSSPSSTAALVMVAAELPVGRDATTDKSDDRGGVW